MLKNKVKSVGARTQPCFTSRYTKQPFTKQSEVTLPDERCLMITRYVVHPLPVTRQSYLNDCRWDGRYCREHPLFPSINTHLCVMGGTCETRRSPVVDDASCGGRLAWRTGETTAIVNLGQFAARPCTRRGRGCFCVARQYLA